MKKLIIVANPAQDSHSFAISKTFEEKSKELWHKIKTLDLYKKENHQDFLTYQDMKKDLKFNKMNKHQELIERADELVFIFPVWRWDAPAILKNWLDINLQSWFAFEYTKKWVIWLLKNKTSRVITTSGAPGFLYRIMPLRLLRWKYRLWFCGIKQKSFKIFGKIHWKVDLNSKIFQEVKKIASK